MNILIVGAGPVGLYLGCLLRRKGFECTVVEKRNSRSTHSRSIGIHPPALRRMNDLGLADELIESGVPVHRGQAFFDQKPLGTLSFDSLPPPFPFVLSVPQHITEAVLEAQYNALGDPVERGVNIQSVEQSGQVVVVQSSGREWTSDRVVACDGRHGPFRELIGVRFTGGQYDAHYLMGDFPDTTPFSNQAAIFLGRPGLVESFPLPGSVRRWVARLSSPPERPDDVLSHLALAVSSRTPFPLPLNDCLMTSSFTAERFEAERFFVGGVALAGDAAHIVSPIGGQGMNLGWMDADWLAKWVDAGARIDDLATYEKVRKASFRKAARRSELNMYMGRARRGTLLRRLMTATMLSRPMRGTFARLFTMDNL